MSTKLLVYETKSGRRPCLEMAKVTVLYYDTFIVPDPTLTEAVYVVHE